MLSQARSSVRATTESGSHYSSVGGDLAAGVISNLYYPQSNRGAGIVFENAPITTGGRMANGLVQEFILRRFTSGAQDQIR